MIEFHLQLVNVVQDLTEKPPNMMKSLNFLFISRWLISDEMDPEKLF